jgi:dienelactone hydrolase
LTLYAVEPKNAPGGVDFARAIAFYPGCRLPLESGRWASRRPLLVLIGAADDWTPAAPCEALAAEAKAQGEAVDIVVYPGAYHDFDHPALPFHTGDGLAFTANGGGSAHTGTNPAAPTPSNASLIFSPVSAGAPCVRQSAPATPRLRQPPKHTVWPPWTL